MIDTQLSKVDSNTQFEYEQDKIFADNKHHPHPEHSHKHHYNLFQVAKTKVKVRAFLRNIKSKCRTFIHDTVQSRADTDKQLLFDTKGMNKEMQHKLLNPGPSYLNYEPETAGAQDFIEQQVSLNFANKVSSDLCGATLRETNPKHQHISNYDKRNTLLGFGYGDESFGFDSLTKANTHLNQCV